MSSGRMPLPVNCYRSTFNRRRKKWIDSIFANLGVADLSPLKPEAAAVGKSCIRTLIYVQSAVEYTPDRVAVSCSVVEPAMFSNEVPKDTSTMSTAELGRVRQMVIEMLFNLNLNASAADRMLVYISQNCLNVPTSIRGLMRGCSNCEPRFLVNGVYYHIGLKYNLKRPLVRWNEYQSTTQVEIQLNYYGLSIAMSLSQHLRPFLGRIRKPLLSEVFL
ncbi:unnamed protein product, partial [Heterobilharzia americana]